jgi:ribosomal protein S18 acetylase RimI-like enzyme
MMRTLTFRTLCEATSEEMAVSFRAIFNDYALPAPRLYDGRAFERRFSFEHLDRAASLLVTDSGVPAGTIVVARRGRVSHISGLGVATQYRRQGLARTMLSMVCDAAATRGDSEILVEVPSDNRAARSLYEGLGFVARRHLVGYAGAITVAEGHRAIEEIDTWSVVREIALHGPRDLPWFFHPSSLAGCSLPTRAYQLESGAFAIVTPRGTDLHIRALFVRPELRRRGLARHLLISLAHTCSATTATVMPFVPIDLCDDFFSAVGMARSPLPHVEMARVASVTATRTSG